MQEHISLPSTLEGFHNTKTTFLNEGKGIYRIEGILDGNEATLFRLCPKCGCFMHVHDHFQTTYKHINIGTAASEVVLNYIRYKCSGCGHYDMPPVPFSADGHRFTKPLETYVRDLLALGLTNRTVSEITGVNRNIIKDIDYRRLMDKYTINGKELKKPEKQARYIGIDEFKLHRGNRFAFVVVDLETGHIIWLGYGNNRETVRDFFKFVGDEWMSGVEAISCDMNVSYPSMIRELYPDMLIVYDRFHVIMNITKKLKEETRKEEEARLRREGKFEEAGRLRSARYILSSKRETLEKKDKAAAEGKAYVKENRLFGGKELPRRGGNLFTYKRILAENELLFTVEVVMEKVDRAYSAKTPEKMRAELLDVIKICKEVGTSPFKWCAKFLTTYLENIVTYPKARISNGRVEGVNNLIKTVRRQAYGYGDDEYFFLKIMDASRRPKRGSIPQKS